MDSFYAGACYYLPKDRDQSGNSWERESTWRKVSERPEEPPQKPSICRFGSGRGRDHGGERGDQREGGDGENAKMVRWRKGQSETVTRF